MPLHPHSLMFTCCYRIFQGVFIYNPCFDHVLRRRGIPATLEGLVWLSESIEACLTTFKYF